MAPFVVLESLGVRSFPRHRSLLGALAFRALYVIVRTGSLGVHNYSCHRPLLGSLVFGALHSTTSG